MPPISRGLVIAVLATLLAAILIAPVAGPLGTAVYAALGWICHQRPERSWELWGRSLAVCVRCLGLYVGALLGAAAGLRFWKPAAAAALAVLGADWLVEAIGWLGSRPPWRFAIGLAAGALIVPALWGTAKPRAS